MEYEFSDLIVAPQNHYNKAGSTSQGKGCASCGLWMNELPTDYGYFVGEKSAVIYGLCKDCAHRTQGKEIEVPNMVFEKLSGKYRLLYYSIVYGDPDSTEGWGPTTVHSQVKIFVAIYVILASVFLSGCWNRPINIEDIHLHPTSGINIPIDANVSINASDQQHGLMISIALEAFSRGFSIVVLHSEDTSHLIVKPKSTIRTSYYSVSGDPHAPTVDLYCRVETFQENLIGEYEATARATGYGNAYKKAFIESA